MWQKLSTKSKFETRWTEKPTIKRSNFAIIASNDFLSKNSFVKHPHKRRTFLHQKYLDIIEQNEAWIFTQHNNILPEEWACLRKKFCSDARARIMVLQNAIFKHAYGVSLLQKKYPNLNPHSKKANELFKELPQSQIYCIMTGPVAIITFDSKRLDIENAKSVLDIIKSTNGRLSILGAKLENKLVGAPTVESLRDILPKKQLNTQLLAILKSPVAQMSSILTHAAGGHLSNVLRRRKEVCKEFVGNKQ